jgi:hypothetical protein
MPSTRRQLSLFLPEPERSLVDAVRAEVDPRQHALIPAHVTLCREDEVEDWDALWKRLEALGPIRVELELGAPLRLSHRTILLPVSGSTASFDELRTALLGESAPSMRPHVTLLHPRNGAGKDGCLDVARKKRLPASVILREVSMIEQVDGGTWRVLASHGHGDRGAGYSELYW